MREIKGKKERKALVFISNSHETHRKNKEGKLLKANGIASVLLNRDSEHIRIYISHKIGFLDIESIGWYVQLVYDEIKIIIADILRPLMNNGFSRNFLDTLWREM
jgi:hypothetical protein